MSPAVAASPDPALARPGPDGIIPVETLTSVVRGYNPRSDSGLIAAAYDYGKRMHAPQKRSSGEPYFMHPVAVAMLLAEQRLDDATIITALLHDTIEDTGSTYDEISQRFGEEIAQLVDGVTKLTKLQLGSATDAQAENFRKLLMAMSKDLRVLLVKLADRLHNMRTIKHLAPEKQIRKARETMDIFAPLAGRMGMQWMREELEDISFRILNPDARSSIIRRFVTLRSESGDVIPQITDDIRAVLAAAGIRAVVFGREKKPYSVWRKMEERKQGFSRLSDIYGFRIITDRLEDCYIALGAVHQRWRAVPGRFKDYISQPKSNGYRSIHTTVSGRDGKQVEVQIRTQEMHTVAESGVAAHWSYKDGQRFKNPFAVDPYKWLRSVTERLDDDDEDSAAFLEHMKLEMFTDQVFCFTPKGEVIQLPRGATPIDFAYAIHTRIGDSCVGAKVDGRRVPLWTKLRNGQSVTIIRADGQRPQPSWEDMVVTGRAKSAIRRSLREEQRATLVRMGREIARVALERVGKKPTDKALETAARRIGIEDAEELLARLGGAEMTGRDLVGALYPELLREASLPAAQDKAAAVVIGLGKGQEARPAPCCNPIPGERIVGIAVRGKGVMVHAIDCAELATFEDEADRWIDLRWADQPARTHAARVEVTMANDAGVLGRICTLVGEHRANITDIAFTERKPDFYRVTIEVEVRDLAHLSNVITAIEADSDVAQVRRIRRSVPGR